MHSVPALHTLDKGDKQSSALDWFHLALSNIWIYTEYGVRSTGSFDVYTAME